MHLRQLLLFILALSGLMLCAKNKNVKLKSGENYQIRCLRAYTCCVMPSSANPEAIVHTEGDSESSWWTITKESDGFYSIRNAKTMRYMTFDGHRTSDRRYVRLSRTDYQDASRWKILSTEHGIVICHKENEHRFLDVRQGSNIVGTYHNIEGKPNENECFVLINTNHRIINDIDGQKVVSVSRLEDFSSTASKPIPRRQSGTTPGKLMFTLNGRKPVYDARTNVYLFPIPENIEKEYTARIAADYGKGHHLFVNGKAVASNGRCSFPHPENGREFRISIASDSDTLAVARITFTRLPIIEIVSSGLNKSQFSSGTFRLSDPEGTAPDSLYAARLRYRGNYAMIMNKKSFAVKLTDNAGKAVDRKLLDLRSDNYWILDAMAVDHARMRNRVAMDLWLDFSTAPYSATSRHCINGVRGRLVEVFWNGNYQGIYNLSEQVDRKQLDLKRTDGNQVRGCLYKSQTWTDWTLLGRKHSGNGSIADNRPPCYDNRSESWAGWTAKYPKAKDGKKVEWKPLFDGINLVSNSDDNTFISQVGNHFDLPVVRDYWLFIELLFAMDNTGKNMHWAVNDMTKSQCLTPVPWDLDGTFGRSWDGHRLSVSPQTNFRSYLHRQGEMNLLFERLYKLDVNGWKKQLAKRYRALRRTHFDPERLIQHFTNYFRLLKRSGAAAREHARWNNTNGIYLDFNAEEEYLRKWINQRICALDSQYDL